MTDSSGDERARPWRRAAPGVLALAVVLLATGVVRARLGAGEPLWLDETFTGVMASQTSLGGVWAQLVNDVGAPLFPLAAFLWSRAGGLSDAALRAPALAFALLAPLAALAPTGGASWGARRLWALALACWIPGLWYAQDARCYSLLLLTGAAASVTFAQALQRPDLRRALAWALAANLLILTHYHGLLLAAVQGLILLAVLRARALRLWPAAAAFAPTVAWLAYHLPHVAAYGRTDDLWSYAGFLMGSKAMAVSAAVWVAAAVLAAWLQPRRKTGCATEVPATGRASAAWLAAAASLAAAVLAVGIGFLRPSLTERYLTGFVPGLLLGLALLAARLQRRAPLAPAALAVAFVANAAVWTVRYVPPPERDYSFEAASTAMMQGGVRRLVFFWDHPAAPVVGATELRQVGGFFFRRAGRPVTVEAVVLPRGMDAQPELLRRAVAPDSAILWMYDRGVRGTAARAHPPRLAQMGAGLRCQVAGPGSVKILACIRTPDP
jgi:hypothetical protein